MSRLLVVSLASLSCLVVLGNGTASAQGYYPSQSARPNYGIYQPYGGGYNRPLLSPYLDLLRGGDPAVNYFLGTVPEFQRRANAAQFRSAIQDLEQRTGQPTTTEPEDLFKPLTSTGHPTAFLNTGGFFGNTAPVVRPGIQPPPRR
jgi:hypothetical protein